jgi:hypothetical protein
MYQLERGNIMANHWNKDEVFILKSISDYRKIINNKEIKEARKITFEFARALLQNTPELQHRSQQAIFERLAYLDNLLAGVFEKHHYAKKDQALYLKEPRENGSKEPNFCNTRHSYNGAVR